MPRTDNFGNPLTGWSTFNYVGSMPAGSNAVHFSGLIELIGYGRKRFSVFNFGTSALIAAAIQSSPDGTNGWEVLNNAFAALPAGSRYSFNTTDTDGYYRLVGSVTAANVFHLYIRAASDEGTWAL